MGTIQVIKFPRHATFTKNVPDKYQNELKSSLITLVAIHPNTRACFVFTADCKRFVARYTVDSWIISRT